MQNIGKALVIAGIVTIIVGAVLMMVGKVPWLGRLPGDIVIHKKSFTIYIPVVTCLIISIILTIIFWLIGRR
jgi:hypothetical protein